MLIYNYYYFIINYNCFVIYRNITLTSRKRIQKEKKRKDLVLKKFHFQFKSKKILFI